LFENEKYLVTYLNKYIPQKTLKIKQVLGRAKRVSKQAFQTKKMATTNKI